MTVQRAASPETVTEADILEYLKDHPEFLSRHPEVVEALEVPHACGGAVSLVEYQVSVLRERSRSLRAKVRELVRTARANEELSQRMHVLTLALLECRRLDEILECLYRSLEQDFAADLAAVRLFAPPRDPEDAGLGEFVGADAAAVDLFEAVLRSEGPVCGRLKPAQSEYLFAERGPEVGSGAMLALGDEGRIGLLAICSRDPERYRPGMGTVFVRQLAGVVSRVLAVHVAPAA